MDKSTLVAVLSQRKDISTDQANNIATQAEKTLNFVKEKVLGNPKSYNTSGGAGRDSYNASHSGIGIAPVDGNNSGDGRNEHMKTKAEGKLQNYFDSMERPEFNYDRIKRDFEAMFHDPKSALRILRNRLNQSDKESLIALLSSNRNVSHEDAEKMVNKIIEAKETVIRKAEQLEEEVTRKVEQAKVVALHEAENVRKAAVAASWWLFATAIISAGASALGGILALT